MASPRKKRPASDSPHKKSPARQESTKLDNYPTAWDILNKRPPSWVFLEFPGFSESWREYFVTDAAYGQFQSEMVRQPESGDVMPGCGGLRKIRWPDPRRGKGKRGGLRIIYMIVAEALVIVLVDVYDKDEADDLTAEQKRVLSRLAAQMKTEILNKLNRRTQS